MEGIRILITFLSIMVSGITIAMPTSGLAYEPHTTHRALTKESISFFESFYEIDAFTNAEAEAIVNGGAREDSPTYRPLFHFYDPIYNRGVRGNTTSKTWAYDTELQTQFDPAYLAQAGNLTQSKFSADSDFSWDRAVYEYVHGDKMRGLETLGHILHLVQDASVPAHTHEMIRIRHISMMYLPKRVSTKSGRVVLMSTI